MPENYNDGESAQVEHRKPGATADLGLLLMALLWGINFPVVKYALPAIPPLAFNALRFSMAAGTVLLILRSEGPLTWPQRIDWPRILALGVLGNVVYQGFFIFGIDSTLAGNASILLATIPIWTVTLSTLRGHERPGIQVWLGVFTTVAGMCLVVLGGGQGIGVAGPTLLGDLLMVGAAITWSAYSVGSRGMVQKYGSLPVTAWTLWIGTPGLVAIGAPSLARTLTVGITPSGWAAVAYSGILALGLAYILWYRGVRRIGNSRTAAYTNLTPVIALMVAWLWLGEVPNLLQTGGAGVVLVGLTLARLGRERGA